MFAEIPDLETELERPLDEAERKRAVRKLNDVLTLIRERISDLDIRAATSDNFADVVKMVQVDAVCRVLRNPEGVREESDEGRMLKVDIRVSSGVLEIFPSEWKKLGIGTGSGFISLDAWRFMR